MHDTGEGIFWSIFNNGDIEVPYYFPGSNEAD